MTHKVRLLQNSAGIWVTSIFQIQDIHLLKKLILDSFQISTGSEETFMVHHNKNIQKVNAKWARLVIELLPSYSFPGGMMMSCKITSQLVLSLQYTTAAWDETTEKWLPQCSCNLWTGLRLGWGNISLGLGEVAQEIGKYFQYGEIYPIRTIIFYTFQDIHPGHRVETTLVTLRAVIKSFRNIEAKNT